MTISFLSKVQLKKIAVGAVIAAAGAVAVYLSEFVAQIDFGVWTPIVTAAFAVLINFLRKLAAEY